jgi:hypothetical protein
MKDHTIAASSRLVEAIRDWHRSDLGGESQATDMLWEMPDDSVLELEDIQPALLQAKDYCENGDCGYSRENGGDGEPGCPWCSLTLKWKQFAEATPARSAEPPAPSPDTETPDGL